MSIRSFHFIMRNYILKSLVSVNKSCGTLAIKYNNCLSFCSSTQLQETPLNEMTKRQRKAAVGVLRKVIVGSHAVLRKSVQEKGEENAETVWKSHLQNEKFLKEYSSTMHQLATTFWKERNDNSRIHWIYNEMQNYYHNGGMEQRIDKEFRKVSFFTEFLEEFNKERERLKNLNAGTKLKVLDVGSCYNPFGVYDDLDITAVDLCPFVPEVKKCDFLSLKITDSNNISKRKFDTDFVEHCKWTKNDFDKNPNLTVITEKSIANINCNEIGVEQIISFKNEPPNDDAITELPSESFDVVIFCLLISYIPSPKLRFQCCQKAYELLKPNGILLIVTPDSKRAVATFHLAKLWKVTMQHIGFERVIYKKEEHYHGSVYRKALCKEVWKIDAEKILTEMKAKRENIKIVKRFRNFDYDSVPNMFYINQDLQTDKSLVLQPEKLQDFETKKFQNLQLDKTQDLQLEQFQALQPDKSQDLQREKSEEL